MYTVFKNKTWMLLCSSIIIEWSPRPYDLTLLFSHETPNNQIKHTTTHTYILWPQTQQYQKPHRWNNLHPHIQQNHHGKFNLRTKASTRAFRLKTQSGTNKQATIKWVFIREEENTNIFEQWIFLYLYITLVATAEYPGEYLGQIYSVR